jgi:hypothetical protein
VLRRPQEIEMAKVSRGSEQAMIRLPAGMRDKLKDAAEKNGRSMNAEIVERLEWIESFDLEEYSKRLIQHEELERRYFELSKEHAALEAYRKVLQQELHETKLMAAELRADQKLLHEYPRQIEALTKANDRLRERYASAQKSASRAHEVVRNLVNLLVRRMGVEEAEIETIKNSYDQED